jgi:hypothetical protein
VKSIFTSERDRETEREEDGERERERKREGERESKSEREGERIVIFIFKRNDGCLGAFYLSF